MMQRPAAWLRRRRHGDSVWQGQKWGIALRFICDDLAYGLATAAAFAWLWPDAAA